MMLSRIGMNQKSGTFLSDLFKYFQQLQITDYTTNQTNPQFVRGFIFTIIQVLVC